MTARRLLWAALAVAGLVLLPAAPASAHASLLATTPAAGYSVSTSPRILTLVFDEAVSVRSAPLRLTGSGPIALGTPRLTNGDRWLSASVNTTLPGGRYTVHWQVVAEDGDVVAGSYGFGVGTAAAPASDAGGQTVTRGLVGAVILRWLMFAALSIALGGLAGQWIARRVVRRAGAGGRALPQPRAPVALASAVGMLCAIGLAAHLLGSGNVLTGLGELSVRALLRSRAGQVDAVEIAAFALAALVAFVPGRVRLGAPASLVPQLSVPRPAGLAAAVPLLAVVLAEGQRSHIHERGGGWGAAVLAVHLLAAAIWVGALTHVITVAWRWRARRAAAHRVVWEYARIAVALLLVVVATGTVSAVVALPRLSALWATGYGRVLLIKLGLVVAALGCAVAARHRLRLTSSLRPATADVTQPGRAARAERLALGAVLACTAALVSIAAPSSSSGAALALPPPTGPVLRLAALDGELTVYVTASDGRLEVRTSAPDPTGDGSGTSTAVSAQGPRGPVALRRCGSDCFTGGVQWAHGRNTVRVTATSKRWTGGTATFTVPWPPARDDRLLHRVLAAMRATPRVTVHEAITSNSATPAPAATRRLTGADFVSVEPYSSAGAVPVTVLGRDEGTTTISVAMTDQRYYFQLKVGPDHRIHGEVITTPQHLYTRTFDY